MAKRYKRNNRPQINLTPPLNSPTERGVTMPPELLTGQGNAYGGYSVYALAQIYNTLPIVFACVNYWGNAVSNVKFKITPNDAANNGDADVRLPDALVQAQACLDKNANEWLFALETSYRLTGQTLLYKKLNMFGKPYELAPINPMAYTIYVQDGEPIFRIVQNNVSFNLPTDTSTLDLSQVVYIHGKDFLSDYLGIGAGEVGYGNALALAELNNSLLAMYQNRMISPTIVQPAATNQQMMSVDQKNELTNLIKNALKGSSNAGRSLVSANRIEALQLGGMPDTGFMGEITTREKNELYTAFGLNAVLMEGQAANYAELTQRQWFWVNNTLRTHAERIANALEAQWLINYGVSGYRVTVDLSHFAELAQDKERDTAIAITQRDAGMIDMAQAQAAAGVPVDDTLKGVFYIGGRFLTRQAILAEANASMAQPSAMPANTPINAQEGANSVIPVQPLDSTLNSVNPLAADVLDSPIPLQHSAVQAPQVVTKQHTAFNASTGKTRVLPTFDNIPKPQVNADLSNFDLGLPVKGVYPDMIGWLKANGRNVKEMDKPSSLEVTVNGVVYTIPQDQHDELKNFVFLLARSTVSNEKCNAFNFTYLPLDVEQTLTAFASAYARPTQRTRGLGLDTLPDPILTLYGDTVRLLATKKEGVSSVTEDRFKADMEDLLARVALGLPKETFIVTLLELIEAYATIAYQDGMVASGLIMGMLSDEDVASLSDLLADQRAFVQNFADALYGGTLTQDEIDLKPALWWSGSVVAAFGLAMVNSTKDPLLEWIDDPECDSCETCAALDGQVHRASVWKENALYPQCGRLQCTIHCCCTLKVTNKRQRGSLKGVKYKESVA